MATAFDHTHVSHISRMGRRRSQSVTLTRPMTDKRDSLGQSIRRKRNVATVRVKSVGHRNPTSSNDDHEEEGEEDESEEHEMKGKREKFRPPTVTRITRPTTGLSASNDHVISTGAINMSVKKQTSSTYITNSQINLVNSGHGNTGHESSDSLSHPLATSSAHLINKKDIFDQEFSAKNSKDHARMNDTKSHGSIKIGGREKFYDVESKNATSKASVGFLAAIIAIIIGVIAFVFGLTALILVLLLRSTVMTNLNSLNSNSSSSSSSSGSGALPSACSNYQEITETTRLVSAPGYALGCDTDFPFTNRTHPLWIRFAKPGGTQLPLTTPGMNICGSEGTGWYAGSMPTTIGSIVNGTVCFTWYNSVCRFSTSISVAHCGSFYLYLLPPPPACMIRYCTI